MIIKMSLSYDGSKFNGFQRLPKQKSVQKEIEDALKIIYDKKIQIKGAGRTDAGVHANNQVISFEIEKLDKKLKSKLNKILNPNIVIKKITKEKSDFHARFSAIKKEYIYKIYTGRYKSSLNDYYLQDSFKYDLNLMKEASKYILGTHDFKNFISGENEKTTSTIYSVDINKYFDTIEIRFVGSHFYRYMVRNLVGALLEVGKYKQRYDIFEKMLDTKEKITLPTAPACGLYLNKIWY